jgi:hypothetical protein
VYTPDPTPEGYRGEPVPVPDLAQDEFRYWNRLLVQVRLKSLSWTEAGAKAGLIRSWSGIDFFKNRGGSRSVSNANRLARKGAAWLQPALARK